MRRGRWRPAAALGLAAVAGCSWHRAGEVDALAPAPAGAPSYEEGMTLGELLERTGSRERGDFTVWSEIERIAEVRDVWRELPLSELRRGFEPDPGADYVVVLVRSCRDWTGRERWSDERASWFLLPGGRLAAFDHYTFGPRCAIHNDFRPSPPDAPQRTTERDLLRSLEQRHPPGRLPLELRFQRGLAFASAGRLREARALLRFADDGLDARADLQRPREVTAGEEEAFEAETRRLRRLRAELLEAIQRAEAEAEAAS